VSLLGAALGEVGDAEEFGGEGAQLIGEEAEDGEYFGDGAEGLFRAVSGGGVDGVPCFVGDAHGFLGFDMVFSSVMRARFCWMVMWPSCQRRT
jgi:hypothetical protein